MSAMISDIHTESDLSEPSAISTMESYHACVAMNNASPMLIVGDFILSVVTNPSLCLWKLV